MIVRLGKNYRETINRWKQLGYKVKLLAHIKPCLKRQRQYGIQFRLTTPTIPERGCQGAIIHIK